MTLEIASEIDMMNSNSRQRAHARARLLGVGGAMKLLRLVGHLRLVKTQGRACSARTWEGFGALAVDTIFGIAVVGLVRLELVGLAGCWPESVAGRQGLRRPKEIPHTNRETKEHTVTDTHEKL